jgi:hypothetical protein
MKILDPAEHTPMTIDDEGTQKFEGFLDRNYSGWRDNECLKEKNAGTIQRDWMVGTDDMERVALFRGQYVEIYDQCFDRNEADNDVDILYGKHLLCDIDGDLTPVAVWGKRGSGSVV